MEMITQHLNMWTWLLLAALLAIAEMALPGVFLIWIAGAAALTGIISGLFALGWQLQLPLFVVLAIASIFIGRNWLRRHPIATSDAGLNDRAARLIGQIVTVEQAIESGEGKVQVGDSPWLATGPDAPVGTRVRIVAVEGATLKVEMV